MKFSLPFLILGIWLVISPWILGFFQYNIAAWNVVAIGIIAIVFSFSRAINRKK